MLLSSLFTIKILTLNVLIRGFPHNQDGYFPQYYGDVTGSKAIIRVSRTFLAGSHSKIYINMKGKRVASESLYSLDFTTKTTCGDIHVYVVNLRISVFILALSLPLYDVTLYLINFSLIFRKVQKRRQTYHPQSLPSDEFESSLHKHVCISCRHFKVSFDLNRITWVMKPPRILVQRECSWSAPAQDFYGTSHPLRALALSDTFLSKLGRTHAALP